MADYTTWQTIVNGGQAPLHEGQPQPGFYKTRTHDEWHPVAIWEQGGKLTGAILSAGNKDLIDPDQYWVSCCGHPIAEAEFRYYEQNGKWKAEPDPLPSQTVAISNRPADPYEDLLIDVNDLIERLSIDETIENKDDAERVANTITLAREVAKNFENLHKSEKSPFLAGGREIDKKYKPTSEELRRGLRVACLVLGEFQDRSGVHKLGGLHGRQIGSKIERNVIVDDIDEVILHFSGSREMKELAKKLAQKTIKAGGEVPGCRVQERRIAV